MTSSDLRCPRCAAHAPAGAQWCSLCYADLRPAAPEQRVDGQPASDPAGAPSALPPELPAEQKDELGQGRPAAEPAARPRGKHARRAAPEDQPSALPTDLEQTAAALLAQLAASESGSPLGRYSGLVDTSAKKVGLMLGGAVVAMIALFLLMVLAGSIL